MMRFHLFPPSSRVTAIVALKHHLALAWETAVVDLGRGDQRAPNYRDLNPNLKMPTLEDDDFVLWESNAILIYLASQRPESGLWPPDPGGQADVLRWMFWESAHWDAESIGMVAYEKRSKAVLGHGEPDAAFIARGVQNFARFGTVLDGVLKGRTWLLGEQLTIADFSIGGLVPSARCLGLPLAPYAQILRWYEGLASLPGWKLALVARETAAAAWLEGLGGRK